MDVLDAIFTRRSIRKYKSNEIPEDYIFKILKAGMCAPTSRNKRPWLFILIKNKKTLKEIGEFHPYGKMLKEAPLAIVVCGDLNLQENEGYIALDCAAACQNILLACHGTGLGACWVGIYPRKERINFIKNLLKLSQNILPIAIISIGFPAEKKEEIERFEKEKVKIIE